MEEIKINEIMDVIEFEGNPLTESPKREENEAEDEIRIYVPPQGTKRKSFLLRFIITTVIFFLLFLALAMLIKNKPNGIGTATGEYLPTVMTPDSDSQEETTAPLPESVHPPVLIDESKIGVELNINETYSLHPLLQASNGIKILIVHSHNSEYVSEELTVSEAGNVISQILTSAEIEAYHCLTDHDSEGNIGSYLRMKESVTSLIEKYPDTVCVIDVHDSDSGLPLTFTVGTDGDGWRENLRLAEAVCGGLTGVETAVRFLPGTLGQDCSVLTLNVGIGGKDTSDEEARAAIAAFAEAFIEICKAKASAP